MRDTRFVDDTDRAAWERMLNEELAFSRGVKSRLLTVAALLPDLILAVLSLDGGSGGYVPAVRLRASVCRMRRRLDKGREIAIDVWWTEARLMPELAKVKLRTRQATLCRKFQTETDLGASFEPVAFLGKDLPSNLAGSDLSWLTLQGAQGVRYLGAEPIHLALIGMAAGWKYPVTE